jgi:Domain of unknown function (DUF1835)
VLHVTNGDSTTATMERAGLAGEFMPWRDVLHEGPVPNVPPDELRRVRAEYLAGLGFPDPATLEAELRERDERLAGALAEGEPVVLWFEHDLYDQLQLIQILAGLPDLPSRVELICIGTFPGRPDFKGLGELDPDELASLWPLRTPVTPEHVHLARAAWDVVRGDDPRAVARVAATPDERLPFLALALRRLLEELPGVRDGLPRSERHLLRAIADGADTRAQAFLAAMAAEEAPFMGDTIAFDRIDGLAPALVAADDGGLRVTPVGHDVLAGRADRVQLVGFDRWLGGLHVTANENLWRWDAERNAPTR